LLGRLLFKDIIVDPPQGDLRYGIGDFIINDREIIRLAVHSASTRKSIIMLEASARPTSTSRTAEAPALAYI
jgi:hypothetical protein